MAIWDKKPDKSTLSADSRKCLSCGDNLTYVFQEDVLKCKACGSTFYPDIFEISDAIEDKIDREVRFDDKGMDDVDRFALEKRHEIICNSCGSVVVSDKNTISTFCAFCGSPAIVGRRIQKEFLPDGIIPFKVTHDEAKANIRKWAKSLRTVPHDFMSEAVFGKMTPLYVPFWLVDADCMMLVSGSCYKYITLNDEYHEYMVRRNGSFTMRLVPFDGSRKISDRLMEAIEPYDYSELTEFNDSYLNGVYAERYDQSPSDMARRIANRFRDYMYDIAVKLTEQNEYDIRKLSKNYSRATNYNCYYALLPVWFINYEYKGEKYQIAVNGQTGEVAGKTPVSGIRRFFYKLFFDKVILAVNTAALLIAAAGGVFIYKYTAAYGTEVYTSLIIGWLVALFSFMMAVYALFLRKYIHRRKKFTEADQLDKMPDPFTYVDRSNMRLDDRTDDYIGVVELYDKRKRGRYRIY